MKYLIYTVIKVVKYSDILEFAGEEESVTYKYALDSSTKYDDPQVWCTALILFLYDWNAMYFKDNIESKSWKALRDLTIHLVENLSMTIKKYKPFIDLFKKQKLKLDLVDSLDKYKPFITKLYEEFKKITGSTGAAKVLHVLAPDFFVMWDAKIRQMYSIGDSPDDYYRFLVKMRDEIREAVNTYKQAFKINSYEEAREDLESLLRKKITRAIDEYNYSKAWK